MCDSLPKYRINFAFDESKMKCDLIIKCKLSEAIEIEPSKYLKVLDHR
jgi:hypothetical protein